jgi:pimeloyl-ACP methyl ester carboxylesterase
MMRVQGLDFHVRDVGGNRPALVFLHYWGGTGRTWDLVIREVAGRHRCVGPDLRGWGGSDKKADSHDLHTQADDVAAIIASLGLSQYILVGQSMGGKIAQILAARRPTGLKGLVLVAPAPPVPIAAPKERREAMLESYQSPAGVEFALSILTSRQLSPELRQQVIDDTLSGSPAAKAAWTQAGMTLDISDIVGNINVPTTVIVGDADKVGRASAATGVRSSHSRNRIHRASRSGPFVPVGGPDRAGSRHHNGDIENSLGPTITASQERDEPWASLIRNTRRQSCRRRLSGSTWKARSPRPSDISREPQKRARS